MKEATTTIHAYRDKRVHRADCQNHDTDECFGCKLAECYESIRELISELKFNPQRDDEDKQQVNSMIERAMSRLPEFHGRSVDER